LAWGGDCPSWNACTIQLLLIRKFGLLAWIPITAGEPIVFREISAECSGYL
jgi:hypothetical protein